MQEIKHPFCTWKECLKLAEHKQLAKDGTPWANLCVSHELILNEALAGRDVKKIMSYWIKAQGGAVSAAKRTLG